MGLSFLVLLMIHTLLNVPASHLKHRVGHSRKDSDVMDMHPMLEVLFYLPTYGVSWLIDLVASSLNYLLQWRNAVSEGNNYSGLLQLHSNEVTTAAYILCLSSISGSIFASCRPLGTGIAWKLIFCNVCAYGLVRFD